MKLTRKVLRDEKFINKFVDLKTSFLINLTHILVETRGVYEELFDESWIKTILNANLSELFKSTNTTLIEDNIKTKNYYPFIVSKKLFHKPVLSSSIYKSKNKKYEDFDIEYEYGIKYILKHFFECLKTEDNIEVFRIEFENFITKNNVDYKIDLIEKLFKYLSDYFSFISPYKYKLNNEIYCIECSHNISTKKNELNEDNTDLIFTISFKLYLEGNDRNFSFVNDSVKDFNNFYKEIKKSIKRFKQNKKIEEKIEQKFDKYL